MRLDDAAERVEQMMRDAAITHREPEGPNAIGACLYCGEPIPAPDLTGFENLSGLPRRWCDAQCRDDWERRRGHR